MVALFRDLRTPARQRGLVLLKLLVKAVLALAILTGSIIAIAVPATPAAAQTNIGSCDASGCRPIETAPPAGPMNTPAGACSGGTRPAYCDDPNAFPTPSEIEAAQQTPAPAPSAQASSSASATDLCANAGGSGLCTANVERMANGLAFYALIVCVSGIIISAALWAMGSKGQNPGQELTGKKGIVLCCTAAFFVGAANPLMNYLNQTAAVVEPSVAGAGSQIQAQLPVIPDLSSPECRRLPGQPSPC